MALTMGSAFGFSGVDWGASLIDRDWAKSDATKQAQANELGAQRAMDFSSAEAARNRDWQEEMSNTAWQRGTKDMMAAGINPMLAAMHGGGATTPGGGQGQGFSAQGAATRGTPLSGLAGVTTAAQLDNLDAQTEKTRAEAKEIDARTPTHAVSIDQMKQNIDESKERIKRIIQETETSGSSARNLEQQTINLKALLPQITATVNNLKASTHLSYTTSGKEAALDEETRQRIKSNLPALEAALKRIQEMTTQSKATVYSSAGGNTGVLLEFLRALNPLSGILGQ